MPYVFFGLVALIVLLLLARGFVSASPAVLADVIRRGFGVILGLIAVVFLVTGRWVFALPVGALAFSLLTGRSLPGFPGFPGFGGGWGPKSPGQTSTVRTVFVEMNLDHDTGLMNGRVLAGSFEGQLLSDLTEHELLKLLEECAADAQSAALLEAYLDKQHPEWRGTGEGERESRSNERAAPAGGPMSVDEAYAVLGLRPGASDDQIRSAHKALMKRFHPDQGGSDYLASKVNEAKDILLKQ
ncbi:MAG: DnaJ domain-containing protein [Pseudomonadota bacterium]